MSFEMRGVRKRFGATVALDGVDLRVADGEIHALLGQNGAGKSTLMKVLSGAHPPDEGTMLLDGRPFAPRHPIAARRAGVAMVYQELALAPHLSVEENMVLGLEPPRREIRLRCLEALRALGHEDIDPAARVAELSIARRQIVEIGRALAAGARVVVLDEPTSSIGREDVERLFDTLRRLRERGMSIVYISHFIEECRRVASRFTVLRDGRAVGGGDMAPAEEIVRLMVGRAVDDLYPRSPRTPGEVVLPSIGLRRGEVVGIAGLVGAGRTELLKRIFAERGWADGVGFVSEDRKGEGLFLNLSIAENLEMTRLAPGREAVEARPWIERLGVACREPLQRIGELSGGNQQKVAIARLLRHGVDVLLLDEPTRGIDVASKAEIYRLIDGLVARENKAVLLVSSYAPELLGVCDRIAVMSRGRLGAARDVAEWSEELLLREATAA